MPKRTAGDGPQEPIDDSFPNLIFLPSYKRSRRKLNYRRKDEIRIALNFLNNEAWAYRYQSDDEARARYLAAREAAQVKDKPVGAHSLNSYPADYTATHNGRDYTLDRHIGRGKGYRAGGLFRIYYTWDDRRRAAILGKITPHAPTFSGGRTL